MRQIAKILVLLFALLSQQTAAQVVPYRFNFEEIGLAPLRTVAGRVDVRRNSSGRALRSTYGPFQVVDASRASMNGVTNSRSPAEFAAMIRDHPGIATLVMIDCPGTDDDEANLIVGRMIHARGMATHVPRDGWVASGAVELFLAGRQRWVEFGARFAVHSWQDDTGRGPHNYSPNAPANRAYLDYYRTLGMSDRDAKAFYSMTNSAPFSRPRYLTANDMARWVHSVLPNIRASSAAIARAQL